MEMKIIPENLIYQFGLFWLNFMEIELVVGYLNYL